MANVLVEETSLEDIADAIRSKNGLTTKYKPAEMADAISAISGGGITPTGTKQINITQNGTITEDVTNYANAQVNANVPNSYSASDEGKVVSNGELTAQTSRQVTANGTYDTTLNSSVEVAVPASGITPTGTKNITTNGDHDVTQYATAHVDVPTGITPSGSQTFTENGTYDVTNLAEAVVNVPTGGDSKDVNAFVGGTWWPQRVVIDTATQIRDRSLNNMYGAEVLFVGSQVSTVGVYSTNSNPNLQTIVWCSSVGNFAAPWIGNGALTVFDGSFTTPIGNLGWQNCSSLGTIILRHTSINALPNVNCLNNTPFKNGGAGGTIYIPKSLYDHLGDGSALDYKSATNWSTIDGYGTITWAQIEGSIYENAYADGTPIE